MPETGSVPFRLGRVLAKDRDQDENGRVRYNIARGPADLFSVGYESGIVTVEKALDVAKSPYTLEIVAQDSGSEAKHSQVRFDVYVIDENDHVRGI